MATNWRELLTNKLAPKKLSVSQTFDVSTKQVRIEADYNPENGVVAVNVHITDPLKPISFGMLTSRDAHRVECPVFGTNVVSCGLTTHLPQCTGCELEHPTPDDEKPT